VAAVSADRAWAVGSAGARSLEGPSRALIVAWNGRAWRPARLPALGNRAVLPGVAAISATNAWAVGEYGGPASSSEGKTLLLHWNGAAWRRVASPVRAAAGALEGVAASSATNVWAVGETKGQRVLVVRWNGIAWRRIPTPQISGELLGVATNSPGNVWVVGAANASTMVIMHWNGTKWTRMRSPVRYGNLERVTLIGRDAWAVGASFGTGGVQTAILHWNGVRWSKVASPRPHIFLAGVAALSADNAWAVGANEPSSKISAAILRWNGRAWHTVPAPRLGRYPVLVDVAATSAGNAWAVGTLDRPGRLQTVITRWNGIRWVPASIMK
jgi:hypothetical protein